jgi:hypothetical protein
MALAPTASAQDLGDIRNELRTGAEGFSRALQSLTGFAALPGVSAANFTVGGDALSSDAEIDKYVLPFSEQFSDIRALGGELYTELTLGYLTYDQTAELLPTVSQELGIQSFSAFAGLGLGFPLTPRTTIRPILLFGYSRIQDNSKFTGIDGPIYQKIEDGLFADFRLDTALLGGALQLAYERKLTDDIHFTTRLRYNQLHADTFDATDAALETSSNFGVFTAHAETNGPTGLSLLERDLRWIVFAANSTFTESTGTDISFFFELGGGIEIVDPGVVRGVDGVSLRASGIRGEQNVNGWSAYLQLEF